MAAPASSNVIGIHTVQRTASTLARPLAGVFELLSAQHRQIIEALRRAAAASAPAQRRVLWAEARRRLLSHERAEEQTVYSTLEEHDSAQLLLEQHGDQEVEIELAVADLNATDVASEEWLDRLREVLSMIEEHARDEETDFFPRAQELLGENTARELEDPFTSVQREVLSTLA